MSKKLSDLKSHIRTPDGDNDHNNEQDKDQGISKKHVKSFGFEIAEVSFLVGQIVDNFISEHVKETVRSKGQHWHYR